jgi:hypothetical protein
MIDRKVIFPDQPIQWHLPRSTYDRCPRCGSQLGYLGRSQRACMSNTGPCAEGTIWESNYTGEGFYKVMIDRGERTAPLGRQWSRRRVTKEAEA